MPEEAMTPTSHLTDIAARVERPAPFQPVDRPLLPDAGAATVDIVVPVCFFVAGISAWYLVKGRAKGFARRSMSIALGIAALLMPVRLYPGDGVAGHELPYQLSKLEAIEDNWGQR
ncbi:hypothetical protein QF035_000605 [Streptomyces umbrinus]|uniref:Uncharacterized protein n=1 Tax=Streptomyces umbrinus TaxID=67370 RepID=A0ABU0SHH7_9ACTN|nr:cytochrome ubiquinol oxidase subunit I [Streptomyces umbrinus]MDQ1023023.1 hypothetical protein [Streptomyces umbrinus]